MLNEQDLRALLAYRPSRPVLSVYLDLDPSAGPADSYRLRLRQLLKEFTGDSPQDARRIQDYVEQEYDWSGRSLVMFSCASDSFFRAFNLAVPLRSRARRMDRPYVKPLADLMDSYGDYGVVLIDKQGARLFHFHLGALTEQDGWLGEDVRHVKRGGASTFPGRRGGVAGRTRALEEAGDRNLKEAARVAAAFFDENQVRRVAIGGTEPVASRLIDYLPKRWQSLVVGTFAMDMTASHAQVLAKALAVGRQAEAVREQRLVDGAITAAAKGQEGVVRLDRTLSAVHDGRVQTLIISDGFRAPGYRCRGCAHVTAERLPRCPFCSSEFDEIEDAVELAVQRVLRDGGDVEVVHNNPQLDQAGRIAGILRY